MTNATLIAHAVFHATGERIRDLRSWKSLFAINFEARKGIGLAPISSNTLPRIALSNTRYASDRRPDWAGTTINLAPPPGHPLALLLDIQELIGHGCDPLTAGASHPDIHANLTAYHSYLATCSVYVEGPAPVPAVFNPAIGADGQAISPAGGRPLHISGLRPCACILWLTATLNLTSGYGAIGGTHDDHIAFRIQRRWSGLTRRDWPADAR